MKVLLIDDEPHVLTVARLLVDWEAHGIDTVLSCGSSEEALQLIAEESPEIILSDINLPGLSGLDLIQTLREQGSAAQVVLITAYSDFAYAQRAVKLGCVDYLLKPLGEKPLNEAVAKAAKLYRDSHRGSGASSEAQVRRMTAWLALHCPEDLFRELCGPVPVFRTMTSCRVGLLCLRHLDPSLPALQSIPRILQDTLNTTGAGAAGFWGERRDILLLLSDQGYRTEALCREMMERVYAEAGLVLPFGLTGSLRFPEDMDLACRTAFDLALSADLTREQPALTMHAVSPQPLMSHENSDRAFRNYLFRGSDHHIRELSALLTDSLTQTGVLNIRRLEHFRSLYNSSRTRCVREHLRASGKPDIPPAPFIGSFCRPDGTFSSASCREILMKDLKEVEVRYRTASASGSLAETCHQIHTWMEDHFPENITLDDLAERFGFSATYLSHTYKKEMGLGLIDDLTGIRLAEACRLMEGSLKTADIAVAVGFSDPKYFSRVFKKVKGVSPAEYRSGLRNKEEK